VSETFVSEAFVSEASALTGFDGFAIAGVGATLSVLKSAAVGGGTFAGSGIGTAASIASSEALVFALSVWANAAGADIVRNVAARTVRIRSNPVRLVE
jgi:hypothetical protein